MINRIVRNFRKLSKRGQRIFWAIIITLTLLNIIFYITSQTIIGPEVRTFRALLLVTSIFEIAVLISNLIIFWTAEFKKALIFLYTIIPILFALSIFSNSMRVKQNVNNYKSNYDKYQQEKLMECTEQILPECVGTSYYGGKIKCKTDSDCQPNAMLEYCNGLEVSYFSECQDAEYFCGAFGNCKICEACD